jgi:hypothetical protein
MTHLPGEFPIEHKTWHYNVRGTGDEPQAWTCGRDVAKAVAELLAAPKWVRNPNSVDSSGFTDQMRRTRLRTSLQNGVLLTRQ